MALETIDTRPEPPSRSIDDRPPADAHARKSGLLTWPWRRITLNVMIVAAGIFFYLGITQPIVQLTQFYMFSDAHSLTSAVQALYMDKEYFLAGVVLVFSILLPLMKLSYLFILAALSTDQLRAQSGLLERLEGIGKWSMHDVLILALTIVYLKSTGLSDAASQPGARYFAISVMLIMFSYGWIKQSAQLPRSERTQAVEAQPEYAEFSPVRRFVVTVITLAAGAALALGLTMPTIKLTSLYLWSDEHSILTAIWALYQDGERFLAGLIFLFSVFFPTLKLFYLIVVSNLATDRPELRQRFFKRIAWLGKWSMMDVLVLALIIFYVNASSVAEATAMDGIYYFTASVVLTMIAYALVKRGFRKAVRSKAA